MKWRIFFFYYPSPTEFYTLSLHDALPISHRGCAPSVGRRAAREDPRSGSGRRSPAPPHHHPARGSSRSEEHTSELQSQFHLVCRLLLEKKKKNSNTITITYTLHSPSATSH